MAESRQVNGIKSNKKTTRKNKDSLDNSFTHISNTISRPHHLPKKAKPFSKLFFPNQQNEDAKKPTSAHKKNTAIRKTQTLADGFYFFKHSQHVDIYSNEASVAECEAVSGAWAKFLSPENVPTTRVWYDENTFKIIGVTSKAIPGFKTNHDDPLQEKDTVVSFKADDIIQNEINTQQKLLCESIDYLLDGVKKRIKENASALPGVSYVKAFYHRSVRSETGTKFSDFLQTYQLLDHDLKFSNEKLANLLQHFQARYEYVCTSLNDAKHKVEMEILKRSIEIIELLQKLAKHTTVPMAAVPYLELLDKKAIADGENLMNGDPNRKITLSYKNKNYAISAKHLRNYRIIKRQMTGLGTRYLIQDTDGHNQNMTKDGWMIDFDMAKLTFVFHFRYSNLFDQLLRKPDDKTFVVTENDIANFPDIADANFYYWAAKKTMIDESIMSKVSYIHKIPENFFTTKDNEVFKNLKKNPIAEFHKFKHFLKYALCDETIYENIARLHMRPYAQYRDEKDGQLKNLLKEMVRDEGERIQKVRDVLVKLPQFQAFLDRHGELVKDLLITEFKARKTKYENKIAAMLAKKVNKSGHKPDILPYQRVINSIDLEKIERRYREIFIETGKFKTPNDETKKNLSTQNTLKPNL